MFEQQSTVVDPGNMLTPDEFHALRQAPEHPRDKAIVDLFLYTGQRNTAIRTLRIKDIDLDEAKYRLNTEADGLKMLILLEHGIHCSGLMALSGIG